MHSRVCFALALVLASSGWLAGCASGPTHEADTVRLERSLDQLAADPKLGDLAPAAVASARDALATLQKSHGGDAEGASNTVVAQRRVDTAWAVAQAVEMEQQRAALQQEHDRLLLASARRDAEQARREAEQQRLQAQIRAEEAARYAQEAEQARAAGNQAEQDAVAARAEADQSKRIAAAQARAAALAKKEADLLEAQDKAGNAGNTGTKPAPSKKSPRHKKPKHKKE
ncbi:MAG: hypothetical protein WBV61_08455 [Rhodanobacteraceae bacterium]